MTTIDVLQVIRRSPEATSTTDEHSMIGTALGCLWTAAALAAFLCAEPAIAGSSISCEANLRLSYWESNALAAESQYGFFLGESDTEFVRVAELARKAGLYDYFRDKSWQRPHEVSYVIDAIERTKRNTVVMQQALFKDHVLVFLSDQLEDIHGSKSLSRGEAMDVLRDYRRYMCWRFGEVTERSTLGPITRNAMLGPAQIFEQISAKNDRIAMDAFVVEDLNSKGDDVMLMVITRSAGFGAE